MSLPQSLHKLVVSICLYTNLKTFGELLETSMFFLSCYNKLTSVSYPFSLPHPFSPHFLFQSSQCKSSSSVSLCFAHFCK